MPELKPCPFCGCDVELQSIDYPTDAKDWIICGWHYSGCFLEAMFPSSPQSMYKHKLVSAWNRRVNE